jgi:hypothetical protein
MNHEDTKTQREVNEFEFLSVFVPSWLICFLKLTHYLA